MTNVPVGRYRCLAFSNQPTAYVEEGNVASFVSETIYRARGYKPPFETLPTEEDWMKRKKGGNAQRT